MHDPRELLADPEQCVRKLRRRGYELDISGLEALDSSRKALATEGNELREKLNKASKEIGLAAKQGDPTEAKEKARAIRERIKEIELESERAEAGLRALLLTIPNLPDDRAPEGLDDKNKKTVRSYGECSPLSFDAKDHVDVAEGLGILDLERAAKISGARFSVLYGAGAALERAIVSYLITMHTRQHGYLEASVPFMVTPETMTGTGQLPKFEADLFKTGTADRDLYLIPTAEVPVTNLHAGEILDGAKLPLAYCAHTPCFRSEAGSYGRDTRGLIRLHQFHKVELVRFCTPESAWEELEFLVSHAEKALAGLGLAYRVVALPAGDISFSAAFCYDIEVWLPSRKDFVEISSCSCFTQFQARRAGIRFRREHGKKPEFVATLNGSGLPIGRTLVAILDQFQQADGSLVVPEALRPFAGFSRILPGGTTA